MVQISFPSLKFFITAIVALITLLIFTAVASLDAQEVGKPSVRMSEDPRSRMLSDFNRLILEMEKMRDRYALATRKAGMPIVRGFIATRVGGAKQENRIEPFEDFYLPNVTVTLRNLITNVVSDPGVTDLSGRFTIKAPATGRYQLCWKAQGFGSGCEDSIFSVERRYHSIGTVLIPLPKDRSTVTLYGTVTLVDGSGPRAIVPHVNANAFAMVSLIDLRGGLFASIPVNNHNQYLFPRVPLNQRMNLAIQEEGYKHAQLLQLGNPNVPHQRIDLTILNSRPRLDPLVALDSAGIRVSNAQPNQSVSLEVRVKDPDGDKLGYRWTVTGGTLSSATDAEPTWTLPRRPGNHAATLTVFDGRGGYTQGSLNVTIKRSGLVFSGTVSGTDAPVLPGAEVDVNGRAALTDQRGFFRLHVPDRKRFVMTIRKRGYAFASKTYYDSVVGGRWTLTRADVVSVDPTRDIIVQNRRRPGDCPGPASDRLAWRDYPSLAEPQVQDGRGNVIRASDEIRKLPGLPAIRKDDNQRKRECGPGMKIEIPAGALVDANGNQPTGLVDIQLSTVDLATPDQMPGNYSVAEQDQFVGVMQSYGAGIVEIFSGITKFDLASGAKAKLIIPVDQVQLDASGVLPPTIPLLNYDEKRAVWRKDSTAKLDQLDGRPAYVADVSHFTAYNTDLIKTGQACLAMQNVDMPANYDLEVTIPQTGGAAPVIVPRTVVGGNNETVLLNLPTDTNIVLVPIRTTDPDPNQNGLPMGVFVVNTGGPQNPAWPTVPGGFSNEPQGPPYYTEDGSGNPNGACSTKVVLQDLGLDFYDPPTPPFGAFLHGLGSFAAVNLSDTDPAFPDDANETLRQAVEQASADYRAQIDPRGLRPTLGCFKVVNRMPLDPGETCPEHTGTGFTPQPALTETTAAYANTIDLGFGREMHCTQDGANIACYVSNYDSLVYTGPGDGTDVTKAQSAVDGFNNIVQPDATVAMEFTQIEDAGLDGSPIVFSDPDRVVKFYVFNGAGTPVDKANLDGLGERPVPQLCMVCHGGFIPNPSGATSTSGGVPTPVFDSRDNVKLDARFLPFDVASFTYATPDPASCNPAMAPPFSKCGQQEEFKALNQMVMVAPPPDPFDPSSTVIEDLVNTWYPGGATLQDEDAVVSAWNADALHRAVYRGTMARGCRTCHVANPDPNYRFEQPGAVAGSGLEGNLGAVQLRVCRQHVMPHARRTHDLFWTTINPSLPAQLQAYGDTIAAFGWQVVGTPGVDPDLLCGNEFTQGGGAPSAGAFTPVATIFSGNCVGCHNAANAAISFGGAGFYVGELDLEPAVAYGEIVGVPANELPSLDRVPFGDNTELNSYLWHKIANTHAGLPGPFQNGGPGGSMPFGDPPLVTSDPAAADTIRDWISNGALP